MTNERSDPTDDQIIAELREMAGQDCIIDSSTYHAGDINGAIHLARRVLPVIERLRERTDCDPAPTGGTALVSHRICDDCLKPIKLDADAYCAGHGAEAGP